jgi:hypothetical protein
VNALSSSAVVGLREVRITGFRSARQVTFAPGRLCALVGEASTGKSNVLNAIWTMLEPQAPAPRIEDVFRGGGGEIRIGATLAEGSECSLEAFPPAPPTRVGTAPPVIFLLAAERTGPLLARPLGSSAIARRAGHVIEGALARSGARSSAAPALAFVDAIEECCRAEIRGLILLIEEPELYLRPQAQRYLYRLLRDFAAAGNQVLYSTHAPAFLNVGRLEELALVEHHADAGTAIVQPGPLPADASFRALSEFDAERSELFLARAALLVEGKTEKLVFPFIFQALGHDADREAISIVECGGKPNMPLFARICEAARVPYVIVHDRDAPPGKKPIQAERAVNAAIAAIARAEQTIVLEPDFEAIAGLHGHSHKPEHAWRSFAGIGPVAVPPPLTAAVERVLALARD